MTPRVFPFHCFLTPTPAQVELTADEESQAAAFARHFTRQVGLYGDVVVVNLIDKKSDQLGLGDFWLLLRSIRAACCAH
jgi:hypothetical protein